MKTQRKPYFGIKWQAFSLTSLLLSALFLAIWALIDSSTTHQYESGRDHIYEQSKQQFDALLEIEGEKITQLAHFTARSSRLDEALDMQLDRSVDAVMSDLSWHLQIEYGIETASLFDTNGYRISSDFNVETGEFARSIVKNEQHDWRIVCNGVCSIEGGAPMLRNGSVVGALILKEPLSNVLLRFAHVSNINTALLAKELESFHYAEPLAQWDSKLLALTNPGETRPVIDEAIMSNTIDGLKQASGLIHLNEKSYELRSFSIEENDVITIADVSVDYAILQETSKHSRIMLLTALIIAECLLLLVLWSPMSRLRKTTNILPLLASGQYAQAKKDFSKLGVRRLMHDETDILRFTASQLCDELEHMQNQLENRASELEKSGKEVGRERDFVNQLFNTMHAVIIIQDSEGYIRQTNKYCEEVTGFGSEHLLGAHFATLLDPSENLDTIVRDTKRVALKEQGEYQHEAAIVTQDKKLRFLAWRHVPLLNHQTGSRQILSIAVDISGRVEAETELAWLARHDSLSGLHNRHSFEEELSRCFVEHREGDQRFGVVFIDLDDFKAINDTFGHHKGDEMIQAVADVLKTSCRDSDFAARMGGDEFALIIRNFHNFDLQRISDRLLKHLTAITIEPNIACSTSIGVAVHTSNTPTPEALLANADSAMYQAKESGKNQYVIYKQSTTDALADSKAK